MLVLEGDWLICQFNTVKRGGGLQFFCHLSLLNNDQPSKVLIDYSLENIAVFQLSDILL